MQSTEPSIRDVLFAFVEISAIVVVAQVLPKHWRPFSLTRRTQRTVDFFEELLHGADGN